MPFARPSLTDLRNQVAQDIATALPGTDPLLRFSNLGILGTALAGLSHLHYGYLDWIAQQSTPFTASGEFLEAWAALKGIARISASRASGSVRFTGTDGTALAAGQSVTRSDGVKYTTTTGGVVAGGSVTVTAVADADLSGLTGAAGNCDAGIGFILANPVDGVAAGGVATTAFVGGADLEADDALRDRMLAAFQSPAHGGSRADYLAWAREVPGVTRAWCLPHVDGAGTVGLYVMFDETEAAHDGFPQGVNGAATGETRATAATGDQLAVANHIYPLQPVTALVRVYAPTPNIVDFTITGLTSSTSATRTAIAAAIKQALLEEGAVGATTTEVPISVIVSAIAAIPATSGFLITVPAGNITSAAGALPVLGSITYA